MRFAYTLVSILLLCPFASCYGQLRFSSVGGENGYSAMRASFVADLDNGFILTPKYGYYRMSDKEIDEAGSTSRYGLEVRYELADPLDVLVEGIWQPEAVGYDAVLYRAGLCWRPFYYGLGFKNPLLTAKLGQERTHAYVDIRGQELSEGSFREVGTTAWLEIASEVKSFYLQGTWQKVVKYSSSVPHNVSFSWVEVPYMTAVLQGYLEDSMAARISYPTPFISPYVSLARYHYASRRSVAAAVSAGLHVKLWDADITGGIEVFEPRRDQNRKTYFTLALEVPM